jgi:flagellar assembly protein FliH
VTNFVTIQLPGRLEGVQIAPQANLSADAGGQQAPGPQAAGGHDGLEPQRKALSQAAAALMDCVRQYQQLQDEMVKQAESQLVELAVNIARKVMMQEIQAGRYEIDPIVQEALDRVESRQELVVRLNPVDLAKCRQAASAVDGDDCPGVRFVADNSVLPAHCLLETPHGIVESAVEANLEAVASAMRS